MAEPCISEKRIENLESQVLEIRSGLTSIKDHFHSFSLEAATWKTYFRQIDEIKSEGKEILRKVDEFIAAATTNAFKIAENEKDIKSNEDKIKTNKDGVETLEAKREKTKDRLLSITLWAFAAAIVYSLGQAAWRALSTMWR